MWGFLQEGLKDFLDLLESVTGSYGIAIIIFTVIVRMLLYPLTVKQQKALLDQKKYAPELQKIQEKYKKKPEELQKRTMEFYKEHNYNPLSGCLPILIQFPLIWLLFGVLRDHDFNGQGFLWIPLLTERDPYFIWPALSVALTFLQTKVQGTAAPGGDKSAAQNSMNFIMPLFIGFISITFPAGLVIYWTFTTAVTVVQYYIINKKLDPPTEEVQKA